MAQLRVNANHRSRAIAKETKNYAQEISKAGDVVRHALEAQIADVEKRYAALTKERNELESLLDARRLTEEAVKAALRFREDVVTGMQNPSFENKRKILELLDTQVTVKDRRIKTTCLIPVCANEVDDVRSRLTRPLNVCARVR